MDDNLEKKEYETEEQYIWRIGNLIDQDKLPHWKKIYKEINKQLNIPEDKWRDESAFRKPYQYARKYQLAGVLSNSQLKSELREMKKERIKLNTEKIEYNRWLREEARDEMALEKIINAVKEYSTIVSPAPLIKKESNKQGILCFGDEHFGVEFELKGLHNEIINAYSPEIFERRMWDLFNQVIDIIKKENLSTINIFSMGDFCDGLLRVSQLMKLRYLVMDSSVMYGNFISNWLNELSKYVNIKFQMVSGNHSELRMLGQPKGSFKEDNTSKIVSALIKANLRNNKNFEFVENPTGMIYEKIFNYNFLGVHGEVKSMDKTLKDFSHIYNEKINYLIAGHLHHAKSETVGIDCETINVPSIIGVDDYSLSINKTSNAGATLMIITENKGKEIEYSLKLN